MFAVMEIQTIHDLDSTKWSTVVEVSLEYDPQEGTYGLNVYNADESQVAWLTLNAVTERPALLEATAWLKRLDFDPADYWTDGNTRHFRRNAPAADQ